MSSWDGKWKDMCLKIGENGPLIKEALQDVIDNAILKYPDNNSFKEITSDQLIGFSGFLADRFMDKLYELTDTMSHWTDKEAS